MPAPKPTLKLISKYSSFSQIMDGMAHVFSDAQMTLSGHRKLVVLMRRLQIRAIEISAEELFNFGFTKLVTKILKCRKGVPSADRIAKFCSVFVAAMVKEESENPTERPTESSTDNDDFENVAAEFIDNIIRHLLRGIESKFKDVRYRVVQLLAYMVNYITEMDEQLFAALKYSLNRRLHDRESMVRIQAVVAISRFQYLDESEGDIRSPASSTLLNALQHDESPEVRRAALLNLKRSKHYVKDITKRARDVNVINRRLVFSRVLKEHASFADINTASKEALLKWGLNDRDSSVKAAAISLLSKTWLPQVQDDILELLENLQVVDSEASPLVMRVLFDLKREKFDAIEIPTDLWKELTVEKAFFVRCYFDFCLQNKLYDNIEKNIPELTKLAFLAQEYFKLRKSLMDENEPLLVEIRAHEGKLAKFERHVSRGIAELNEIRRKIEKETSSVEVCNARILELQAKCMAMRGELSRSKNRNSRGASFEDNHDTKIVEMKTDLKNATLELDTAKQTADDLNSSIDELVKCLKENERAQSHRVNERDNYLDENFSLEERCGPFQTQLQDLEFVIEQLLAVIHDCDFADVAGTRRLMPIITNAITSTYLRERTIALCVKILRKASTDENYFSQLCTEIITDIRDSTMDENDETFVSAASLFNESSEFEDANRDLSDDEQSEESNNPESSAKKRKVAPSLPPDEILVQCLVILQHYLEVAEDTRANSYQLDTLIDTLIRPALSNTENPKIRLLGYRTLGLFTLIDDGLAASNLKFFGISASKAHDEDLKILCMQVIFDILSTHGVGILSAEIEEAVDSLSLARLFYSLLKSYDMPKLQAVVAEGLCKLFLADLLVDFGKGELAGTEDEDSDQESQLLELLLLSYFHPLNYGNQELKQTLAFCVPVYCFSHERHQMKLSAVSGDCFYRMFRADSDYYGFENAPSPTNVLQQLIYWSDPNNVVGASLLSVKESASHFWQAMNLLQIIEQDSPKAVKKALIQNLVKLSLSEQLGAEMLRGLHNAIEDTREVIKANQEKPEFVLDAPTERAIEKFQTSVGDLVTKAEAFEKAEAAPRSRALSTSSQKATEEKLVDDEMVEAPTQDPPLLNSAAETAATAADTEKTGISAIEAEPIGHEAEIATAADLAAIDDLLEEEDKREYDVSL